MQSDYIQHTLHSELVITDLLTTAISRAMLWLKLKLIFCSNWRWYFWPSLWGPKVIFKAIQWKWYLFFAISCFFSFLYFAWTNFTNKILTFDTWYLRDAQGRLDHCSLILNLVLWYSMNSFPYSSLLYLKKRLLQEKLVSNRLFFRKK